MKLTKCKACGAEIAENAKICPHCGARVEQLSIFWIVIFMLCVFYIISEISGKFNEPRKVEDTAKSNNETVESVSESTKEIKPGEVFIKNSYVDFENVRFTYTGDGFSVKNNRGDIIRIIYQIVGIKQDGTYEILLTSGLFGIDETQYEKDIEENGWAVKKQTNMIRPGETLDSKLNNNLFIFFTDDMPEPDVDGDGYYDIIFTICLQSDENTIQVSLSDFVSEPYKIPVE